MATRERLAANDVIYSVLSNRAREATAEGDCPACPNCSEESRLRCRLFGSGEPRRITVHSKRRT